MPVPTYVINVVSLFLCLSLLALQNGCSNTGSGDAQAPATNPAATLSLALTTTNGVTAIVADGQRTVPIRMTVANGVGTPMSGVSVTFATTDGTLSPSPVVRVAQGLSRTDLDAVSRANGNSLTANTDANGIAQVLLTASTTAGVAIVTADVQGFRTHINISFAAGPAARVQLDTSTSTVSAGEPATLTATVTDANGNRVPGETVMFTLSTNTSGSSFSSLSEVMTDANGQATVQYTAGTTAGADTVRVVATSTGVTGSTSITVTAPSGGAVSSAITSISIASGVTGPVIANGVNAVAVRATVQGASGPLSSIPVTFSATAGSFAASATTATAATNASGIATVNLIAPTSPGTATVTASASGFSASTTITFVAGAAAVVQLVANPTTVNANATSAITARVTDAQGNPVSGQTLTFTAPSRGTLSALTGITDTNGQLAVTYTAGATPATDTIQVRTVNGITGTLSITVTPPTGATSIALLVSSPQLDSDGTDTVTLTALVRNASNNFVQGAAVSFAIRQGDSGGIQVVRAATDATGTATALLTTGGDPANRTINVTATTGTLPPATNMVDVTGTTLTLSGATSAVLNSVIPLSILLRDSAGMGIPNGRVTVTTDFAGVVPVTVTTDFTGTATVNVTASAVGTHTIRAEALGTAAPPFTLNISGDSFVLRVPDPNAPTKSITTLDLGTSYTVSVEWQRNGMNIPDGRTVNFFTTRGMLSAPSALTVNGIATVTINSAQAGSAVINAVGIDPTESPSSQINIQFRAVTPSAMLLQAMPTTLGVNAAGSTAQQSVITAIVQDMNGNLVVGREVRFLLTDTTGGTILPAAAVTDDFGRASTVYTAGTVPSAQNGVTIQATVTGTAVVQQVSLTVARQALFVTLGTGNVILTPSNIQFALPYSVLVTDTNGNSVTNATVELTVLPTRYQKGIYVQNGPPCTSWVQMVSSLCPNEDVNHNGVLDRLPFDEDTNKNNELDPENPASVPASVMTDATGFAFFNVVYAREFASWIEVDLRARATVAGSEGLSHAVFFLPGLASDYMNCTVPPPGVVSPYGVQACTVPD